MQANEHRLKNMFRIEAFEALIAIILLFQLACVSEAQCGENIQTPLDKNYKNYFNKDVDPETTRVIREVEKYHLGSKFWQNFRGKDINMAAKDMKFILRYVPNHPQALMLLSSIGMLTDTPNMALPYFRSALKLFPNEALTNAQFGNYLIELGQVEAGISSIKKSIEINPKLIVGYEWLAKAYYRKGDTRLAEEAKQKAKDLGYNGGIKNDGR